MTTLKPISAARYCVISAAILNDVIQRWQRIIGIQIKIGETCFNFQLVLCLLMARTVGCCDICRHGVSGCVLHGIRTWSCLRESQLNDKIIMSISDSFKYWLNSCLGTLEFVSLNQNMHIDPMPNSWWPIVCCIAPRSKKTAKLPPSSSITISVLDDTWPVNNRCLCSETPLHNRDQISDYAHKAYWLKMRLSLMLTLLSAYTYILHDHDFNTSWGSRGGEASLSNASTLKQKFFVLTTFSSQAALKIVFLTTCNAANDKNFNFELNFGHDVYIFLIWILPYMDRAKAHASSHSCVTVVCGSHSQSSAILFNWP